MRTFKIKSVQFYGGVLFKIFVKENRFSFWKILKEPLLGPLNRLEWKPITFRKFDVAFEYAKNLKNPDEYKLFKTINENEFQKITKDLDLQNENFKNLKSVIV